MHIKTVHLNWKTTTITTLVAFMLQLGFMVYHTTMWKTKMEDRLNHLERTSRAIEGLPRILQTLTHQQRLITQGLNTLIVREGGQPIILLDTPRVALSSR